MSFWVETANSDKEHIAIEQINACPEEYEIVNRLLAEGSTTKHEIGKTTTTVIWYYLLKFICQFPRSSFYSSNAFCGHHESAASFLPFPFSSPSASY